MGYEIKLDVFEGPLDLLLYLIRKNEIDIYNIPIALITEQYLEYLDMMRTLNLDLAGEYLILASTLLHIKSKMLLPVREEDGEDEEDVDPRVELVKQLLEYQRYKEAASQLEKRPLLNRDIFTRGCLVDAASGHENHETSLELNVFDLVEAFHKIISTLDKRDFLEIDVEKMSLTDRINDIMERLAEKANITFAELVGEQGSRKVLLYTFLAILELMRLRLIRVYQAHAFGVIRIRLAVES